MRKAASILVFSCASVCSMSFSGTVAATTLSATTAGKTVALDVRGKGGNYAGGKGSSHRGGQYVSPKGKRYSK